ncbi:hypothetical protein L915_02037 [Phytophthora nicotianae]|uniref:Uncharacterized protein n=1 Tax=Phytophthora nicotianae TaxID=4792 RepID=W2HKB2_PHYNI|nr:hypothetical protein L915_02037 [Phytophthora nicotianae]ETL48412.1 hypothetical protein L916_01992 [Phytophthora nicotianae]ETM30741.1 hypothetical protein L914_21583 [Phytophthora nicotianae]
MEEARQAILGHHQDPLASSSAPSWIRRRLR